LDARLSVAFLVAGIGFLTVAKAGWAHAIGVACFFGFILSGFRAALPPGIVDAD
jgi:cytochrome d ubiquinol oxidase subunit II